MIGKEKNNLLLLALCRIRGDWLVSVAKACKYKLGKTL